MFSFDRNYYGDILLVPVKGLNKYNSKKVRRLVGDAKYALVKITDDLGYGKVKIDVYHYDVLCAYHPMNRIGFDIVDRSDIKVLDWNTVMELHNSGDKHIVRSYMLNIQVFITSCPSYGGWKDHERDSRIAIYEWPNCFDEEHMLAVFDGMDHRKCDEEITDWMIKKVESGEVNPDEVVKTLKKKYKL